MSDEMYQRLTRRLNYVFDLYDDDSTLTDELNRICFQVAGITYDLYQAETLRREKRNAIG